MKNKKLIISLIACLLVAGSAFAVTNYNKDSSDDLDVSLLDGATIDENDFQTDNESVTEIDEEETPLATIGGNTSSAKKNLSSTQLNQIRTDLFNSTNNERKTKASNKLVVKNSTLQTTADIRAKEIVKTWSHTRPNGKSWSTVLSANGVTQSNLKAGENLAKIAVTAKSSYSANDIKNISSTIHKSLMNSATHKAVILNKNYQEMGIGVYSQVVNGKVYIYVTEHFKNTAPKVSVSKLSISNISNKTYTGKQIKPSVSVKDGKSTLTNGKQYSLSYGTNKNTGAATVKVTGKGNYTGSTTKTFYIVPQKTSISSITTKSKSATVKFKKTTGVSGYRIAYSTNKSSGFKYVNVSASSTSATINKLTSNKTYYFKVQPYKTVGKTNYYGTFSAVKSMKVK